MWKPDGGVKELKTDAMCRSLLHSHFRSQRTWILGLINEQYEQINFPSKKKGNISPEAWVEIKVGRLTVKTEVKRLLRYISPRAAIIVLYNIEHWTLVLGQQTCSVRRWRSASQACVETRSSCPYLLVFFASLAHIFVRSMHFSLSSGLQW